jgi:hypothetical protein
VTGFLKRETSSKIEVGNTITSITAEGVITSTEDIADDDGESEEFEDIIDNIIIEEIEKRGTIDLKNDD